MPYAYRKNQRLRKNAEFTATMQGKRLSLDGLSLFYARNDCGGYRVGIAVSKKLASAVVRNRIKRQIRSSVMKALAGSSLAYDLVFLARQQLINAGFDKIRKTTAAVLQRTILRNQLISEGSKSKP